jgi:hypothetical protein
MVKSTGTFFAASPYKRANTVKVKGKDIPVTGRGGP